MADPEKVNAALNRIAKWRSLFAGWQLGTRPLGDPESDAVRDHREATILLRVEVTALAGLLIDKGLIGRDEFAERVVAEAEVLSAAYERKFPGAKATDFGLDIDLKQAMGWMKDWRP